MSQIDHVTPVKSSASRVNNIVENSLKYSIDEFSRIHTSLASKATMLIAALNDPLIDTLSAEEQSIIDKLKTHLLVLTQNDNDFSEVFRLEPGTDLHLKETFTKLNNFLASTEQNQLFKQHIIGCFWIAKNYLPISNIFIKLDIKSPAIRGALISPIQHLPRLHLFTLEWVKQTKHTNLNEIVISISRKFKRLATSLNQIIKADECSQHQQAQANSIATTLSRYFQSFATKAEHSVDFLETSFLLEPAVTQSLEQSFIEGSLLDKLNALVDQEEEQKEEGENDCYKVLEETVRGLETSLVPLSYFSEKQQKGEEVPHEAPSVNIKNASTSHNFFSPGKKVAAGASVAGLGLMSAGVGIAAGKFCAAFMATTFTLVGVTLPVAGVALIIAAAVLSLIGTGLMAKGLYDQYQEVKELSNSVTIDW